MQIVYTKDWTACLIICISTRANRSLNTPGTAFLHNWWGQNYTRFTSLCALRENHSEPPVRGTPAFFLAGPGQGGRLTSPPTRSFVPPRTANSRGAENQAGAER